MRKSSAARRRLSATGLLALAVAVSACGRKPTEVRVSPTRTTIYGLKRTVVMSGTVLDSKGREMPGVELNWEIDKAKVATVDAKSGVVTAVGPGRALVKASYAGITGTGSVEIVDAASVTVSPLRMTLAGPPGTKGSFHAETKSSKGATVEARPRWTSSDPKVATIDGDGVASAVGAGRTTVTASLGEVANSADLTVTPRVVAQFEANPRTLILKAGDSQQVTPTALDEAGKEIADPAVQWTTADPKTAKVADGMVTGIAAGSTTIRATCGTRTAEVSVLVN